MPSGARRLPDYSKLARWTVQEVANWAAENGLGSCMTMVRKHGIDGNKLANITRSQLVSMHCPKKDIPKLLEFVNAVNVPGKTRSNVPAPGVGSYDHRVQQDFDNDEDDFSDGGWGSDEFSGGDDDEPIQELQPTRPPRQMKHEPVHHSRLPAVTPDVAVPPRPPRSRALAPNPTRATPPSRAPAALPPSQGTSPSVPFRPTRLQPSHVEPDQEDYEDPNNAYHGNDSMNGAEADELYEEPDKQIDPSPNRGPLPAIPTTNGVPPRPKMLNIPGRQDTQKPKFRPPPQPSPTQEEFYEDPENTPSPAPTPPLPRSIPVRKKSEPYIAEQSASNTTTPPTPPVVLPQRRGKTTAAAEARKSVCKPNSPPPPPPSSSIPGRSGKRTSIPEQEDYENPDDFGQNNEPEEAYEDPNGLEPSPEEPQDIYEECDNNVEPSPPPVRRGGANRLPAPIPGVPSRSPAPSPGVPNRSTAPSPGVPSRPPASVPGMQNHHAAIASTLQKRFQQPLPTVPSDDVYEVPDPNSTDETGTSKDGVTNGDNYMPMDTGQQADEDYLEMDQNLPVTDEDYLDMDQNLPLMNQDDYLDMSDNAPQPILDQDDYLDMSDNAPQQIMVTFTGRLRGEANSSGREKPTGSFRGSKPLTNVGLAGRRQVPDTPEEPEDYEKPDPKTTVRSGVPPPPQSKRAPDIQLPSRRPGAPVIQEQNTDLQLPSRMKGACTIQGQNTGRHQHPETKLASKQVRREAYTDVKIKEREPVPVPPATTTLPAQPEKKPVRTTTSGSDLSQQKWFHGDITRDESTQKLKSYATDGMYLIRTSNRTPKQPYTLAIYFNRKVHNLSINQNNNNCYMLGSNPEAYPSLLAMVNAFKSDKILQLSDGSETRLVTSMPKT